MPRRKQDRPKRMDGPLDLSCKRVHSSPVSSCKSNDHSSSVYSTKLSSSPKRSNLSSTLSPSPPITRNGTKIKNPPNVTSKTLNQSNCSLLIRGNSNNHGRQNPWQTQWINRSSEQNRDVFTCVWCKDSFRSLQEMTEHMKASPRCGMAGMQQAVTATSSNSLINSNPPSIGLSSSPASSHSPSRVNTSPPISNQNTPKEPMSSAVLAKNNINLPRKLVRGQDVWLGRGAEQTRQILKCMWCGQSFKSLEDMTRHMRVTQHYTNIISQEQIISWKTPEDKLAQAQVNAVLTCKVCDESFGSLKELSYHIVKNAHYKEHIIRSMTEGGHGRRRQTRERRKKSLPVRKLLELERMELIKEPERCNDKRSESVDEDIRDSGLVSGGGGNVNDIRCSSGLSDNGIGILQASSTHSSMITCDECNERVNANNFIAHIKICKTLPSGSRSETSDRKSPLSSTGSHLDSGPPSRSQTVSPEGGNVNTNVSPSREKEDNNILSTPPSGGFLSSIEKLIEKSFDVKSKRNQTTGILQRLGIDEEICPPWQNVSSSSNVTNWSSPLKEYSSPKQSCSPSPLLSGSSLMKENGSLGSASSSEDSNSCASLRASQNVPLKLSFPISSIIANEEINRRKCESLSPNSVRSNSDTSTPLSNHGSPHSQCVKNDLKNNVKADHRKKNLTRKKRSKKDSLSEYSEEEQGTWNASDREENHSTKQASKSDSDSFIVGPFNPLMELQKLLDKTDSPSSKKVINSNIVQPLNKISPSTSNSLLAFNWAFNEATTGSSCLTVNTTTTATSSSLSSLASVKSPNNQVNCRSSSSPNQGSYLKCAFCETQFVSKGAYRHHLSKMHFINSDKDKDHKDHKNHKESHKEYRESHKESHKACNQEEHRENRDNNERSRSESNRGGGSSDQLNGPESPHSKFLKYTELAKQLSSKYG